MRGLTTSENIFVKKEIKKKNTFDLPFVHFATMIVLYFNVKYYFWAETNKYNVPLIGNKNSKS